MICLFGGRLRVSVFALVLGIILMVSPDAVFFMLAILGAAVHELAHIYAMKLCGASIVNISVYPCGADIRAETFALSYKAEALTALAGPFASLVLFLLSLLFYINNGGIYLAAFTVSNFLFFAVNIFPVTGLDGGRALLSMLLMRYDVTDAVRMSERISTAAFALLCILSLYLLYLSGGNLSLVFVCIYLYISGFVRKKLCCNP